MLHSRLDIVLAHCERLSLGRRAERIAQALPDERAGELLDARWVHPGWL